MSLHHAGAVLRSTPAECAAEGAACKLRVREVGKSYGSVVALESASFDMREGEFLTLLGPSGSGKTTLLMIIAGLLWPDIGKVFINGKLMTFAPSPKRGIGMVFQNYALFPHLSVFENIAFPLRMRRMSEARINGDVRRALEIVRLSHVADRLPRELSGGQQQRVALARCIVYKPSIVLMDEPLGALDKKLREQMQIEIKQLHVELGTTILYVTHDQDEAMVLSDRICLMNNARIEQIGTPDDLYFRPVSRFSADFFGESNIFPANVIETEGNRVAVSALGSAHLVATAGETFGSARTVQAMVRPERIRLLATGESAENVLEGALKQRFMVGAVTKTYVTVGDGIEFVVTELTTGTPPPGEPGTCVRIGWSAKSMVLLPPAERLP